MQLNAYRKLLLLLVLASSVAGQDYGMLDIIDAGNDTILNAPTWTVEYVQMPRLNMTMTERQNITLTIRHVPDSIRDFEFHVCAEDTEIVQIAHIMPNDIDATTGRWTGNVTVEALFLGHTRIFVELRRHYYEPERALETLDVIVLRNEGLLDMIFKISVGCFVMVLYVNFGAALDLDALKDILLRPIGPAIGFIGQFIVMPVLSFIIGYVLFHDMIELRLGLFFTGATPGGGASNIFTVVLNGNLNLSITMTALSNLFAFGMMPLWIFTLGSLIFRDGNFAIPYKTIATMSCSLVLPLCLGIALQRIAPKMAKRMTEVLKPISLMLIVVIMIFAFTVNSYMFRLFTWKIIMASSALPWIGYFIGWLMATACRQSSKDAITIAIETGIQNTGIAIFMLNFTLPQPQADMTSAVPVASSLMTPLPLLLIYLFRKCFARSSIEEIEPPPTKAAKVAEIEAIVASKSAA